MVNPTTARSVAAIGLGGVLLTMVVGVTASKHPSEQIELAQTKGDAQDVATRIIVLGGRLATDREVIKSEDAGGENYYSDPDGTERRVALRVTHDFNDGGFVDAYTLTQSGEKPVIRVIKATDTKGRSDTSIFFAESAGADALSVGTGNDHLGIDQRHELEAGVQEAEQRLNAFG